MATPPRYATLEDMCRLLVKIVIYIIDTDTQMLDVADCDLTSYGL